jgi:hypothetical protein
MWPVDRECNAPRTDQESAMFESLESRQCMSATLAVEPIQSAPAVPTVTAIGESPEQQAKLDASRSTPLGFGQPSSGGCIQYPNIFRKLFPRVM